MSLSCTIEARTLVLARLMASFKPASVLSLSSTVMVVVRPPAVMLKEPAPSRVVSKSA